jgi:hypothetical protein
MSANLNIHRASMAFERAERLESGTYVVVMNTGKDNPTVTLFLSREEWERVKPAVEMLKMARDVYGMVVQS